MGGSEKFKEEKAHEQDLGERKTVVEEINYDHSLSLFHTLPTFNNQYTPQSHANDPIANAGCTGQYLDSLTKKSTHKRSIRKTNQFETLHLIHNSIHTPCPDPTAEFIKPRKTCRNLSQPSLQSHLNWKIM